LKRESFSLKIKIMFWVLPIIVLGMLLMSFVAFRYINAVIEDELSGSMFRSLEKSAENINGWFKTMMLEPETISSTPAAKRINENFRSFDLQNINRYEFLHNKYPGIFQDIYGANRLGKYHAVHKKKGKIRLFKGDIANRPYFISIMNGGGSQITTPLFSRTTGVPTIFVVAPIIDKNNRPAGLVGAGLSLKYIQQIVKKLPMGRTGFGFIVTEKGAIVSHSNLDSVMEKSIYIESIFPDRKLVKKITSGTKGILHYNQAGEDMLLFYSPIESTGWTVVSLISAAELFAPSTNMVSILIFVTMVVSLLTAVSVYYITGRLIRPLSTLVDKTGEIANGDFSGGELEVLSSDEIGILAESFNRMMSNLNSVMTQLKESEDNYRGIFENSLEGILQTTVKGRILSVNPAMVSILHAESAEQLVHSYDDVGNQLYVNSDDRKYILSELLGRGNVFRKEVKFKCFDGEEIWVSISAYLVRDDEGNPVRIESLISDITRRKKLESERERLFNELVQVQKLEAVGQLAGGVAHDFNNMLAVILGRAELSLMTMDKTDKYYGALQEIQDAAEHSANLTRQLLAFARKQSVAPEKINVNDTIKGMLKLLRRLINEDIELIFNPEAELGHIFIDADQVGQIITNLCVNARDSIGVNGRITISTGNRTVDSDFSEEIDDVVSPGDYVFISVEDNGSGMDSETKKRIFEPFFTTKELGKGTGLGLSTIYGVVKQNGGFITVYSEPGKGTVFKIYIPKYEGGGKSIDEEISPESPKLPVDSVLLVEDDLRLLNISRFILEKLGCVVLTASTVAEALSIAENPSLSIDMIITDVIMPEMNGHELVQKVNFIRPGIKSIYMSGYSSDILAPKGVLEEGINFIQKPFTLKELARKIEEVMGKD